MTFHRKTPTTVATLTCDGYQCQRHVLGEGDLQYAAALRARAKGLGWRRVALPRVKGRDLCPYCQPTKVHRTRLARQGAR